MWGKGRLAEMTQAYLVEYFPKAKAKLYKDILTADREKVFEILSDLKALNALEIALERDYKTGLTAQEELEIEDTENR